MGLFAVLPLPTLPSVWEKVIIPWFSRFSLRKNVPFVLFMPQAQTKALSTQLWRETVQPPGGRWVSQPAWQGLAYVLTTERKRDGFGFTNTGRCCCRTGSLPPAPAALVHMQKVRWTRDLPSKGNKASSSLSLFLGVRGRPGKCGCEKEADTMALPLNDSHPEGSVAFSIFREGKQEEWTRSSSNVTSAYLITGIRPWVTALRAWARPRVVG